VISLPDTTPVTPDLRSPTRFLLRLARLQWRTLAVGAVLGVIWMGSQALMPFVLGRTIDTGVVGKDARAVAAGCLALTGLALIQAGSGVTRHRFAVANWMQAALRTSQLLGYQVAEVGPAVAATATTGEVVAALAHDAPRIGEVFDVSARFAGSIAAFAVVCVLVLRTDQPLGLMVLIGVPLLTCLLAVMVRPLQSRQATQREVEGRLTALGSDTVAGLRVLRGFGGERQFVARYSERSAEVRRAGVRVTGPQATLDAAHIALPGVFAVLLTWLGARAVLSGRLNPGELVTLYGYAAYLVIPLTTATEAVGKAVRARVGAVRVIALLLVRAHHQTQPAVPGAGAAEPPTGIGISDPASGLVIEPGRLTAIVSPTPEDAASLADRLARMEADRPAPVPGEEPVRLQPSPRLGGLPVHELDLDALRRRILVSEAEPRLFTGTLREQLDPEGRHDDARLLAALRVADAADVLEALPGGLDGQIEERGRSLSGGQRQRVALARALLADPDVLVLVEPTSAVDAHTEARIADALRQSRAGRTTVLTSASPLLLDRADRVAFLVGGRVVSEGRHHDLLHTVPAYRDTVLRGEDQ